MIGTAGGPQTRSVRLFDGGVWTITTQGAKVAVSTLDGTVGIAVSSYGRLSRPASWGVNVNSVPSASWAPRVRLAWKLQEKMSPRVSVAAATVARDGPWGPGGPCAPGSP